MSLSVCVQVPVEARRGHQFPETGVTSICDMGPGDETCF